MAERAHAVEPIRPQSFLVLQRCAEGTQNPPILPDISTTFSTSIPNSSLLLLPVQKVQLSHRSLVVLVPEAVRAALLAELVVVPLLLFLLFGSLTVGCQSTSCSCVRPAPNKCRRLETSQKEDGDLWDQMIEEVRQSCAEAVEQSGKPLTTDPFSMALILVQQRTIERLRAQLRDTEGLKSVDTG